jgi:Fic family protein
MNAEAFRDSTAGRLVRGTGGYWAFVPNPLPPEVAWTQELVKRLADASLALGELSGLGRSLPNPHLLIRPYVRREAVLSSRIEGTRSTLSDLYAFEAQQLAMFEDTQDVQEVANYVNALEHGLERLQTLSMSLRLIREVHGQLMAGVRGEDKTPGEFRKSQNWIGGANPTDAVFVPPPVQEMWEALGAFEEFLHAPSTLPPLIRLGLVHYQFEAIHPFLDGNGRIGRLLMTLLACAWDLLPAPLLYLSAYFEANREAYYDRLLAVSQRGAWEEWLSFFLHGIAHQAGDAVQRARILQDERERLRAQLMGERTGARLLPLVELLFSRPVINARQAADALGVQFATAQGYIEDLEQAGVLREATGQARNRVYVADRVLRILEAPSAAEMETEGGGQG